MNVPCGCCATPAQARATHPGNRPWLSAIDYRLGTFASFREALLDDLSRTRELAGLRSRVSDDYTIGAAEMWSAVADVVTFYTERIANEAFIRTATLRDSVLRLVRVIDYELAPGTAATTALAFTLERDAKALIPARTRVQSVPAEGETPQKYETLQDLSASAALNRLRLFPGPVPAVPLADESTFAIAAPDAAAVAGVAELAPGQQVILTNGSVVEILTVDAVSAVDDLLLVRWKAPPSAGFEGASAHRLGRTFHVFGADAPRVVVVPDQTDPTDVTTGYLAQAMTDFALGPSPIEELALDGRYPGLKPGARLLVAMAPTTTEDPLTGICTVTAVNDGTASRNATYTDPASTVRSVEAISGTVTTVQISGPVDFVAARDLRRVVVHELVGEALRFWPYAFADVVASSAVFLPGRRAGWSSVEIGRTIEKGRYRAGTVLDVHDVPIGRPVIAQDGRGGTPVPATVAATAIVGSDLAIGPTPADGATIGMVALDHDHAVPATVLVSGPLTAPPNLPAGSPLELTVRIGSLPTQTISLDRTLLGTGTTDAVAAAIQAAIRSALPGAPTFAQAIVWSRYPGTEIFVAPGVPDDAVQFGPSPDDASTVVSLGLDPPRARFIDGVLSGPTAQLFGTAVDGEVEVRLGIDPPIVRPLKFAIVDPATVAPGNPTWVDWLARNLGELPALIREDGRVLILPPLPADEQRSFLRLDLDLNGPLELERPSAVLLGNVAPASQGETVRNEIVGDGDGSQAFQRFPLRKKPVTFVPASVPGGVASSLQLLVNGALWTEVPTLYGAGATDEVFTTRLADDGLQTIQIGNGVTGSRAPSGRQNLVATYRQGIGVAGRVRAGTLTTLLDRPTGLKSATNPAAADGGADPETLARARETAPGTVRTFGRAISLRDFEDTTLVAGEVAKARAAWVWTGHRRVVHVTVAGQGGATFSPAGLARLAATLAAERDPNRPLLMGNYARVAIVVTATVIVDDRHVAATVLAAARAALLASLSFERRAFAESVDLSEVYATLQDVDGVLAVDIDRLDLKNTEPSFRKAHGVDDAKGQPQPRLLMLPARPSGSPMDVLPAELAWVEVPALDLRLGSSGGLVL